MVTQYLLLIFFILILKLCKLQDDPYFANLLVKVIVVVPCCLYLGFGPFSGDCFGSGDRFPLPSMQTIHNHYVVVLTVLDVHDSIIKWSQKGTDEFGLLLSSLYNGSVTSVNDGTYNNDRKATSDAKERKFSVTESDAEEGHVSFFLIPLWFRTFVV